jgi:hypothetical protein
MTVLGTALFRQEIKGAKEVKEMNQMTPVTVFFSFDLLAKRFAGFDRRRTKGKRKLRFHEILKSVPDDG